MSPDSVACMIISVHMVKVRVTLTESHCETSRTCPQGDSAVVCSEGRTTMSTHLRSGCKTTTVLLAQCFGVSLPAKSSRAWQHCLIKIYQWSLHLNGRRT